MLKVEKSLQEGNDQKETVRRSHFIDRNGDWKNQEGAGFGPGRDWGAVGKSWSYQRGYLDCEWQDWKRKTKIDKQWKQEEKNLGGNQEDGKHLVRIEEDSQQYK